MAGFQMAQWLHARGFRRVSGDDWWAWPEGLPYLALDLHREGPTCLICEYREAFPPRTAVGERKEYTREQYEADTGDTTDDDGGHVWLEYRFPWPMTRAQAEAIADEMGWNDDQRRTR